MLQLVDASTLKREVPEGVYIMAVRELIGGMAKFRLNMNHDFLLLLLFHVYIYLGILMNLCMQMVILFCVPRIYFGKPRGFGTNNKGEDTGFNTEVYSVPEIPPPPPPI
jgi:3-isopropylmalate dehydrogenase